jgi:DNA-binding beta-propeller fold protein YncE
MKRFLWLGFVLLLHLICTGCGDTFRPIITPNPPTFPNPAAAHSVVAIGDNGTIVPGSVMVIDVSGDSIASVADCTTPLCIGIAPVHAVQQTAGQVLVVNQSGSLSKVNFSSITTIASTTTITLPAGSTPNFVAVAPNQTTAYVTLPSLNEVGVVNTSSNVLTSTIAVGSNPYALAVTPDNTKLYVANLGDGSLSAFNTQGPSARSICDQSGTVCPPLFSSAPIWLSARSDSQRVYVLEFHGTLGFLDTTSTAGPDTFSETSISMAGATNMIYDPVLNRIYIPGGAGGQAVAIVDVSQSIPSLLEGGPILIPTVPPTSRGAGDPCATSSATSPTHVVAVAALPDGSRAYVGSFYGDNLGNVCPQVTVIDASSNTVKSSIAVPGFPDATVVGSPNYVPVCATTRFRFMMAAAGDSTRAYMSSCDGGSVHIIDTSNDTYNGSLSAPPGSRYSNPPQNPVFLFAGP